MRKKVARKYLIGWFRHVRFARGSSDRHPIRKESRRDTVSGTCPRPTEIVASSVGEMNPAHYLLRRGAVRYTSYAASTLIPMSDFKPLHCHDSAS